MWIICHTEATTRLYEPWMLEFVDDPVADLPGDARGVVFDRPTQIVESVGAQLIDRYDAITEHEPT